MLTTRRRSIYTSDADFSTYDDCIL